MMLEVSKRAQATDAMRKIYVALGVTPTQLLSKARNAELVEAREKLSRMLRDKGFTLPEIGVVLDRHHTSIMHYLGVTQKSKDLKRKKINQ